jgi:hypothetical protein
MFLKFLNDVLKLFPFYLSKVSMDICENFVIIMFPKFQISLFQFMFKTLTPKFYHCPKIFLLVCYLLPSCIPNTQWHSMEGNNEDEIVREGKKY